MSDVVSNDDLNALAAEYVLGTLDYEERKGANALLEVDPEFRAMVLIWERRFGELHLMVEAVEPDPAILARIKPRLAISEQVPLAISSHEAERQRPTPAPMRAAPAAAVNPAPVTPAAAAPTAISAPVAAPDPITMEPSPAVVAVSPAMAEPGGSPVEPGPAASEPGPAAVEPSAQVVVASGAPETDSVVSEARPDAVETSPAVVHAELKLAELAALLPVPSEPGSEPAEPQSIALPNPQSSSDAPPEAVREEPELAPPAATVARSAPVIMRAPQVQRSGRGWVAATLTLGIVTLALGGLIGAWRFFPDQLPAQLRANALLNLSVAPPVVPARPRPPPFDE
jgi:hypothetical protein